jgi:hypothetical protein
LVIALQTPELVGVVRVHGKQLFALAHPAVVN